jgi:Tol biopolymer transport system component
VTVTNDCTAFALSGEIYAIRLDGSQMVERYGRHHTNNTDYDAAAFASPSPDGKRIMFRSNWGSKSGRPVGAYVIDIRPICP